MTNNIKNKINELYQNTPEYVTMVSYGYKYKNNIKIDQKCIVFGVKKKKNLSEIPKNEVLPRQVKINGQAIRTDVIEIPEFKANICYNYLPVVGEPLGSGNPADEITPHRRKQRPLKGGVSTTNITRNENLSIFSAGTLGLVVVDSVDGRLVGLTNNHVYTSNPFIASDRNLEKTGENVYQNLTAQPADLDGGSFGEDEIGKVKRYYPLNLNGPNYIDAALTTLNSVASNKILGLIDNYNYLEFATTEEIDGLLSSNTPVFKAGRTTGPVGHPLSQFNTNCSIVIKQINVTATVSGYLNSGIDNSVDFEDCLSFAYTNSSPGVLTPGDSGSVLVAQINNKLKIIGLCFAGGPMSNPINPNIDGTLGLANRIDKVAELLEIQPWTSETQIKLNSEDPACTIIVPGLSSKKFMYFNGKKYYQLGTTNEKSSNINCLSTQVPTPTPTLTPTPTKTPIPTPTPTKTSAPIVCVPTNVSCCVVNSQENTKTGYVTWTPVSPECYSNIGGYEIQVAYDSQLGYNWVGFNITDGIFSNSSPVNIFSNIDQHSYRVRAVGPTVYSPTWFGQWSQIVTVTFNNGPFCSELTPTPTPTKTPGPTPTKTPTPTPTKTPGPTPTKTPTPTPTKTPGPTPTLIVQQLFDKSSWSAVIPNPYRNYLNQAADRWSTYIKFNSTIHQQIKNNYNGNWNGIKLAIGGYSTINDSQNSMIASCGPTEGVDLTGNAIKFNSTYFQVNINTYYQNIFSSQDWINILTHELGHALGIGIFWNPAITSITGGVAPSDNFLDGNYYTGAQNAYNSLTSLSRTKIPLESTGGDGTQSAHWENDYRSSGAPGSNGLGYTGLYNELMVGYYSPGFNSKITKLSINTLVDFGYEEVNPGTNEGAPTIVPGVGMINISGMIKLNCSCENHNLKITKLV